MESDMSSIGMRVFHGSRALGLAAALVVVAACSSSSNKGGDTCSNPGDAVSGPADSHCGTMVQATDPAACNVAPDGGGDDGGTVNVGDGGPTGDCDPAQFGPTMYGHEGDDDDCKYHVTWSSTPICENGGGTTFTVKATKKTDGSALTGAAPYIEAVQSCTYPIPNAPNPAVESPPGTYTIGPVVFDRPGTWVVRFHFFGTCEDGLETSPHGHAAFFVKVP
jgi:hypothetical protein